jgi:hypothetical protein
MHLKGDRKGEELVRLMDRSGVRSMGLMARYYMNPRDGGYGTDAQSRAFAKAHPGRFLPLVGGQRGELGKYETYAWANPDTVDWYLRDAEALLRTGEFFGLGEYILFHHAYDLPGWGQLGAEVRLPADSALMHRIAALGAKYRTPVLFHLEAEPEQTAQAVRLIEANPGTTFIWAHNCGRASAAQIRGLLQRFPRLMCDLGHMMVTQEQGGYGRFWPKRTPHIHLVQQDGGELYPEMRQLFEDFSDRLVLGTDTAHTPALRFYEERINAFRQLLSQLSPAAARRIAHENADRLAAARALP